jgi:hypothetical protein
VSVSRDLRERPSGGAEWRIFWNNREYSLAPGENLLGRTREASGWIEEGTVSRRHALIHVSESGATIEDLGSRNGTVVDGQRLQGRRPLVPGTEVWLGHAYLVFMQYDVDVPTGSADDDAETPPPGIALDDSTRDHH